MKVVFTALISKLRDVDPPLKTKGLRGVAVDVDQLMNSAILVSPFNANEGFSSGDLDSAFARRHEPKIPAGLQGHGSPVDHAVAVTATNQNTAWHGLVVFVKNRQFERFGTQ